MSDNPKKLKNLKKCLRAVHNENREISRATATVSETKKFIDEFYQSLKLLAKEESGTPRDGNYEELLLHLQNGVKEIKIISSSMKAMKQHHVPIESDLKLTVFSKRDSRKSVQTKKTTAAVISNKLQESKILVEGIADSMRFFQQQLERADKVLEQLIKALQDQEDVLENRASWRRWLGYGGAAALAAFTIGYIYFAWPLSFSTFWSSSSNPTVATSSSAPVEKLINCAATSVDTAVASQPVETALAVSAADNAAVALASQPVETALAVSAADNAAVALASQPVETALAVSAADNAAVALASQPVETALAVSAADNAAVALASQPVETALAFSAADNAAVALASQPVETALAVSAADNAAVALASQPVETALAVSAADNAAVALASQPVETALTVSAAAVVGTASVVTTTIMPAAAGIAAVVGLSWYTYKEVGQLVKAAQEIQKVKAKLVSSKKKLRAQLENFQEMSCMNIESVAKSLEVDLGLCDEQKLQDQLQKQVEELQAAQNDTTQKQVVQNEAAEKLTVQLQAIQKQVEELKAVQNETTQKLVAQNEGAQKLAVQLQAIQKQVEELQASQNEATQQQAAELQVIKINMAYLEAAVDRTDAGSELSEPSNRNGIPLEKKRNIMPPPGINESNDHNGYEKIAE
ncbi:hypothetical protein BOX15_Mlig009902g1 [Macrostomum lignano]|uniref:Uncharacterized protein n=1 Tax=Macrostomum lignano TaxID=282301 RepID=A0A267G6X6_9PLAT|nr:hypothetical protein BOX15_Mlig009902g1 [Macrostomum lignano]